MITIIVVNGQIVSNLCKNAKIFGKNIVQFSTKI
jgi:hypothetical protein